MRIQLDLLGGLAGDMFIAALLDAFPEHEAGVLVSIAAVNDGQGGACRSVAHRDAVLVGRRFEVDERDGAATDEALEHAHSHEHARVQGGEHDHAPAREQEHEHAHEFAHAHAHAYAHTHADAHARGLPLANARQAAPGGAVPRPAHTHPSAHTSWRSIRAALTASALAPDVLRHALGIFGLLAEAEAQVHGVPTDDVAFHEVGAWDSVADIVGAAHLIAALDPSRWHVSAVPLGSGRVRTAHGLMPVPAPATARLLTGFATVDDGIGGERVTPTGAALLRYLCADYLCAEQATERGEVHAITAQQHPGAVGRAVEPQRLTGTLRRSGIGFGTRVLPGISNCVRVLVFDDAALPATPNSPDAPSEPLHRQRQLAVIEFEVDDQSAEDLAMGLEHLRAHAGVFDVVQMPVFGKKGRMMTAVRVLAAPASMGDVIDACFRETTTIGLRHHQVDGATLTRRQHDVAHERGTLRVKSVERPGGATAKTEADDVASFPGHAARQAMRHHAERDALEAGLISLAVANKDVT